MSNPAAPLLLSSADRNTLIEDGDENYVATFAGASPGITGLVLLLLRMTAPDLSRAVRLPRPRELNCKPGGELFDVGLHKPPI